MTIKKMDELRNRKRRKRPVLTALSIISAGVGVGCFVSSAMVIHFAATEDLIIFGLPMALLLSAIMGVLFLVLSVKLYDRARGNDE